MHTDPLLKWHTHTHTYTHVCLTVTTIEIYHKILQYKCFLNQFSASEVICLQTDRQTDRRRYFNRRTAGMRTRLTKEKWKKRKTEMKAAQKEQQKRGEMRWCWLSSSSSPPSPPPSIAWRCYISFPIIRISYIHPPRHRNGELMRLRASLGFDCVADFLSHVPY